MADYYKKVPFLYIDNINYAALVLAYLSLADKIKER